MMNHRLLRPVKTLLSSLLPFILTPSPPSFQGVVLSGGSVTQPTTQTISGGTP